MNESDFMREFVKVMKALSDANRIKIVKMLQHRVLCVCEMRELLGVTQPTVSKHLKVLEEAGLVRSSKDGQWVDYHLAGSEGGAYAAALLTQMADWLEEDPEIGAMLERLPFVSRTSICGG